MVCKVDRGNRYADSDSDSSEEEYEADLEEDAQEVGYASEPTVGILDQVNLNSLSKELLWQFLSFLLLQIEKLFICTLKNNYNCIVCQHLHLK